MSWRVIEASHALTLDDGTPSYEFIVGWDPPTQSYFVIGFDHSGKHPQRKEDGSFFQYGFMHEMPDWEDLEACLRSAARHGWIEWPLDPELIKILLDDKIYNLNNDGKPSKRGVI